MEGSLLAVGAGFCGALSSVFGKAAVGGSSLEMPLRVVSFGLIFLCNALMWNLFVKAMTRSSAAQATIINTGANFLLTALLGMLLFSEQLSLRWWVGAALIAIGLAIVAPARQRPSTDHDRQEKKEKKS